MWRTANPARASPLSAMDDDDNTYIRALHQRIPSMSTIESRPFDEQSEYLEDFNTSGINSKADSEAGDREGGGPEEEESRGEEFKADDIAVDNPEDEDYPEDFPKGCPSMDEIVADANNSINGSYNHSKASVTSAKSKRSGKSNHNKGGSFDTTTLDNMSVFSYTSSHSGGSNIDDNKSVRSTRSVKSNKSTRSAKSNKSVGSSDDANKSVRSARSTKSGRSGGTDKSNKSNVTELSAEQATDAYRMICGTVSDEGAQQQQDTNTAQEEAVATTSTTDSLSSGTSRKKKKETQTSYLANIHWGPSISESFTDTGSLYSDTQTARGKKAVRKRWEENIVSMEGGEDEMVMIGLKRTEEVQQRMVEKRIMDAVQKKMEEKRIMDALAEEEEENMDNDEKSDKVDEDDTLEAAYAEDEARENSGEAVASGGEEVNNQPNETGKQEDSSMAHLDKVMDSLDNDILPDISEASRLDPFVLHMQVKEARSSNKKDIASISSIHKKNSTTSPVSSNSHSSRGAFSFAKLKSKRFFGKKKTANNVSSDEQGMDKLVSLVRGIENMNEESSDEQGMDKLASHASVIENMEDEEDSDLGNVDTEEVKLSYNRSDVDDPSLPSANNGSIGKGMKSEGTSESDTKKVSTSPVKDVIKENSISRVESTKSNNTDGTDNVTVESGQEEMKEEVDALWDDDDAPLSIEVVDDGQRVRIGYYENNVPKTITSPNEEGAEEAGLFERIFACGAPPFQCNANNNHVTGDESITTGESSVTFLYEDEVDKALGIEFFQDGNRGTRTDYCGPAAEVEEDMKRVTSKIILRTHVTPGFELLSSNDGQAKVVDSVSVKIDAIADKLERKREKQQQEKKRENQVEKSSSLKSKRNLIRTKILKKLKEKKKNDKKNKKQMKKISEEVEDNAPTVVATKRRQKRRAQAKASTQMAAKERSRLEQVQAEEEQSGMEAEEDDLNEPFL